MLVASVGWTILILVLTAVDSDRSLFENYLVDGLTLFVSLYIVLATSVEPLIRTLSVSYVLCIVFGCFTGLVGYFRPPEGDPSIWSLVSTFLLYSIWTFLIIQVRFQVAFTVVTGFGLLFLLLIVTDMHQPFYIKSTVTIIQLIGVGAIPYVAYLRELLERKAFLADLVIAEQRERIDYERNRSESILVSVLPKPIVERMKQGEKDIADSYASVSVLFADIVGFTAMSASLSPIEVVKVLDQLFNLFDNIAEGHGLEKIKTIGDAYMLASGVSGVTENSEIRAVLAGLEIVRTTSAVANTRNQKLAVRVGICTGPVVGGIIGTKRFLYDIWGDTVNTAQRMESYGVPGRVQIAESTRVALLGYTGFEERVLENVKGKGTMRTFLVPENLT
jgi:class 3 adenylate cyclase